MRAQSSVQINTEWDIVSARQHGRNLAKELGFGTVDQARIATAVSELARNIYLYASTGEIEIAPVRKDGVIGLEIIAKDSGPGIKDIRQALEDGFTTSGGLGAGLPGVRRLMEEFSIESDQEQGTTIKAIKWLR